MIPPLSVGSHRPSGKMFCAMEWIAHIAGEPWSDAPACVCPTIAQFFRQWNDTSTYATRNGILLDVLPQCIGTAALTEPERLRVIERRGAVFMWWVLSRATPIWLQAAEQIHPRLDSEFIEMLAETQVGHAELLNADSEAYIGLEREWRHHSHRPYHWLKSMDAIPGDVRLAERASRMAFDGVAAEAGICPAKEGYLHALEELNKSNQGNNLAAFAFARELMELSQFWLVQEAARAQVQHLLQKGFGTDYIISKVPRMISSLEIVQRIIAEIHDSLKRDLFPLIFTKA